VSSPTLERLLAASRRPWRRVLGVISGTSADSIDVALCRVGSDGGPDRVVLDHYAEWPIDPEVRRQILDAAGLSVRDLAELHLRVGEIFAEACLATLAAAGVEARAVDLVGSHGQTVYHHSSVPGATRATLQVGDGDAIAERTGLAVVSDFRARDVAAGGEGAPLTPRADVVLYGPTAEGGGRRAVLNLGGIANVTLLDPDPGRVSGFDTGPANALIDRAVRSQTGGAEGFDRDGLHALAGRVDERLVERLLADDAYLARSPPKSTGFELYGDAFVARAGGLLGDGFDLVATLTEFTARSVASAFARHVAADPPLAEVVVAGGGVRNPVLLGRIAALLAPIRVVRSDDLGVPADAREAMAFAVLADLTLRGVPGSLPAVTGARRACVLGKLSFPRPV